MDLWIIQNVDVMYKIYIGFWIWLSWFLCIISCLAFQNFVIYFHYQEVLKKSRMIDDRIIHALNTSIPTDSFAGQVSAADQCKKLYEEVSILCFGFLCMETLFKGGPGPQPFFPDTIDSYINFEPGIITSQWNVSFYSDW